MIKTTEQWRIIRDRPVECRLGNVEVDLDPFCEHCGPLDPFVAVFCDGSTWWCEGCIYANGYEITENELALIHEEENTKKANYYVGKLCEMGYEIELV